MLDLPLRPYQEAAVDAFLARRDKRLLLAHAVGAGKTLTSIACAQAIQAKRILVVAPALGRLVWLAEFKKWTGWEAHSIRFGRHNKSLSKANMARQHAAFHADIQVVSYQLLKDIRAVPRDLIIFDEVHALRDPLSKQSRIAKAYLRAFPKTPCLALSATPIPTDISNIWNVVDTLFPNALGPRTATGGISFAFRECYMKKEQTEYGTRYYGSKEDALPRLERLLAPLMHRATEADFAKYVPPLMATCMHLDDDHKEVMDVAHDWISDTVLGGGEKIAVICYYRDTASRFYEWVKRRRWLDGYSLYIINGETPADERAAMLIEARRKPKCLLIATCESVRESISLSFVKHALITEWRASPAQATQLLGRFARSDSTDHGITRVVYAVFPEEDDKATQLESRLKALSNLMKADAKSETLQNLFKPQALSEHDLNRLFEKSFKTFKSEAVASWDE